MARPGPGSGVTSPHRQSLALPPLSLYIHIPWCVRKCPYCDFNSHEARTLPEAEYVAALSRDLEHQQEWARGRTLHSIFFGGGTPSLFSAHSIDAILRSVDRLLPLPDDLEITLEANPGTAEQQRFRDYRAAGINRLSIGVQSFHAPQLQALGRIHDGTQARGAVIAAQTAGFEAINIDLMHGLPGQNVALALADLDQAIDLGVGHLSWYQLTVEPNTAFYRRPPVLPEEDQLADILDAGLERLARAGLTRYEVSAYARSPKHRAQHNLNYWQFGDYLGIGAGAHGKLTEPEHQRIIRYHATRAPADYLARAGQTWPRHVLEDEERVAEFMLNALRYLDGFQRSDFEQRTGLPWQSVADRVQQQQRRGLLEICDERIRPTPLGFDFLNDLTAAFLP